MIVGRVWSVVLRIQNKTIKCFLNYPDELFLLVRKPTSIPMMSLTHPARSSSVPTLEALPRKTSPASGWIETLSRRLMIVPPLNSFISSKFRFYKHACVRTWEYEQFFNTATVTPNCLYSRVLGSCRILSMPNMWNGCTMMLCSVWNTIMKLKMFIIPKLRDIYW